jgi:excisionase family DNA binding protein
MFTIQSLHQHIHGALSVKTLYRLTESGALRSYKVGGKVLISPEQWQAFLRKTERQEPIQTKAPPPQIQRRRGKGRYKTYF